MSNQNRNRQHALVPDKWPGDVEYLAAPDFSPLTHQVICRKARAAKGSAALGNCAAVHVLDEPETNL